MKTINNFNQYIAAIKKLKLYSKHYYELDNPIASDEEYDKMYRALKEYEENILNKSWAYSRKHFINESKRLKTQYQKSNHGKNRLKKNKVLLNYLIKIS